MGKSRKLIPSKIEATWAGLHNSSAQTIQSQSKNEKTSMQENNKTVTQLNPPFHHYSIAVDGKMFDISLPHSVKSVFDEELVDSDEGVKHADLLKVCLLYTSRLLMKRKRKLRKPLNWIYLKQNN